MNTEHYEHRIVICGVEDLKKAAGIQKSGKKHRQKCSAKK